MGILQKAQQHALLLTFAGGTFVVGSLSIYMLQREYQKRVRSLPHYIETFKIIGNHDGVKKLLRPPISVGKPDLADRRHNYVGETDSKLRIPVSGTLAQGFLNVHAVRKDPKDEFEIKLLELETPKLNIVVYDNPNAKI